MKMKFLFDFDVFSRLVKSLYLEYKFAYTLEEALYVFKTYFIAYEYYMGDIHPNINRHQILKICKIMPYFDDESYYIADGRINPPEIEPTDYVKMIKQHFVTGYSGQCDYNINHFFSGKIRENRFYECCL
jgi:hypothetical protein